MTRWTIAEINAFDEEAFVARLGFLFEGSPWIVAATWQARPFASLEALHRALRAVVGEAAQERQLALIRAHPDLVGRAALAGTLSRESTGEQSVAGLDPNVLSPDEVATFDELNRRYRDRFGFPFVICARENKKEGILAGFAARLKNSREQEIEVALGEIGKICYYRLLDVVA